MIQVSEILKAAPLTPPQPNGEIKSNTPTQGTPPEPPPPVAAKDDKIASRLEIFLKREAQVRDAEQRLKQTELDLQDRLKRLDDFEAAKAGNYKKALESMGVDYGTLTESMLKDGEIPTGVEIKKVREDFEGYKKQQAEEKIKLAEDNKKAQEEQFTKVQTNFKADISQFAKAKPERYEFLIDENGFEAVYDIIDGHWQRTYDPDTKQGQITTIEQACDQAEKYLEDELVKRMGKPKFQALLNAVNQKNKPSFIAAKQQQPPNKPPTTLTNQLSGNQTQGRKGVRTDDQRIQDAIAYAKSIGR